MLNSALLSKCCLLTAIQLAYKKRSNPKFCLDSVQWQITEGCASGTGQPEAGGISTEVWLEVNSVTCPPKGFLKGTSTEGPRTVFWAPLFPGWHPTKSVNWWMTFLLRRVSRESLVMKDFQLLPFLTMRMKEKMANLKWPKLVFQKPGSIWLVYLHRKIK